MKITCNSCQASLRIDPRLVKPTGSAVKCCKCQQVFKVCATDAVNRRKYPRTQTRNLISHITIDETGKWVSQGLSKATDVSQGGILLKTPHPIESGLISLLAVDSDNKFIEINGRLVYCKKTAAGIYHSGIKFVGTA